MPISRSLHQSTLEPLLNPPMDRDQFVRDAQTFNFENEFNWASASEINLPPSEFLEQYNVDKSLSEFREIDFVYNSKAFSNDSNFMFLLDRDMGFSNSMRNYENLFGDPNAPLEPLENNWDYLEEIKGQIKAKYRLDQV